MCWLEFNQNVREPSFKTNSALLSVFYYYYFLPAFWLLKWTEIQRLYDEFKRRKYLVYHLKNKDRSPEVTTVSSIWNIFNPKQFCLKSSLKYTYPSLFPASHRVVHPAFKRESLRCGRLLMWEQQRARSRSTFSCQPVFWFPFLSVNCSFSHMNYGLNQSSSVEIFKTMFED